MEFFGFDITKKKAAKASFITQIHPSNGQGPYTGAFSSFIPRKVDGKFYETLRESIPIIDAALWKLVALDGSLSVEGNNPEIVDEIKEWLYNVPVNGIQKGLQAFHQGISNEAFEQGFGLGEFMVNKKRTDIIGLTVADSKTIKFRRNANNDLEIFQKAEGDQTDRLLNPETLLYFSVNNENTNPYGTSVLRSTEFVSKILTTMHNSLLNTWERYGDPSFNVVYKAGKGSIGADSLEKRREKISEHFTEAVKKKRAGESADFISAIDNQSDITISVIGADNHTLEFEIPSRHVIEQIVAKTGLPPWMLGLHWSTTAFLSDKEVTMLLADVATRQAGKMPFFYRLIRTLLVLRGRTWEKGDWSLKWDQVNLYDEVKKAQARFLNLQGDYYLVQNASQMGVEIDQTLLSSGKGVKIKKSEHHKTCNCSPHDKYPLGHKGGWGVGTKELQRPIAWTELDKIEAEYEAKLKAEWEALRLKTFEILKLNEGTMSLKEETPSNPDAFSISEEQYAQMLLAMDKMIGTFLIDNPDSPLRWFYGESCSLGYLRAAYDIGGEAPNLNIIKNSQTYEKLMKEGFKLVKNDITKNIQERIMAEMQAQVLAGSNPRHVANHLKKMFGKANGDWERLARTEMSMAAEISKREEWKSWEIDYLEFFPSPDACTTCSDLAGEYPIDECPIPAGMKTHPRCRCTTTIGKRSMV